MSQEYDNLLDQMNENSIYDNVFVKNSLYNNYFYDLYKNII